MEVVPVPNTMSDCMKTFLDDLEWPEDIEDPQLKQVNYTLLVT